jgi:hypothetical protein
MALRETDAKDPMELVGVRLPVADDTALREMAECFAEEFIRLGHREEDILALFQSPHYNGPHRAYCHFGEDWIRELINKYGRIFRPIENG